MVDLENVRREYLLGGLQRKNLLKDPFAQFELWMEHSIKSQLPDPTAMVLATVDDQARPSQRIVLLKHFDKQGFVFFTNYNSAKACDINANPNVSLHFPWHMMERQAYIKGVARKLTPSETLTYFVTRPRDSQLAAWASRQSQNISSREALLLAYETMKKKFADSEVPCPSFWGGYRVVPDYFEFWQGGAKRLHDRFCYDKEENGWAIHRLAP